MVCGGGWLRNWLVGDVHDDVHDDGNDDDGDDNEDTDADAHNNNRNFDNYKCLCNAPRSRHLDVLGVHPEEGCLSAIVRATEGYSGSDLSELCAQVRMQRWGLGCLVGVRVGVGVEKGAGSRRTVCQGEEGREGGAGRAVRASGVLARGMGGKGMKQ